MFIDSHCTDSHCADPVVFLSILGDGLMSQLGDYDFSFRNPFISDKTIDQLLEEGYIGVPYDFVADQAVFAAICQRFKDKVKWTKTAPDNDGDVGLMTSNVAEFYELTQFMMENFGWYPAYYSNQEVDKPFIFTAKNEIEANAIKVATSGEYGWRGSLYSLDCFGMTRNSRHLCFIFATQPEGSEAERPKIKLGRPLAMQVAATSFRSGLPRFSPLRIPEAVPGRNRRGHGRPSGGPELCSGRRVLSSPQSRRGWNGLPGARTSRPASATPPRRRCTRGSLL